MDEQQRQEEIKKIINICKQNGIQYDTGKLDFITKDTRLPVKISGYNLLVTKNNKNLEIDGFYSAVTIENYISNFAQNRNIKKLYKNNKEIVGYIFMDKNKNIYVPFN